MGHKNMQGRLAGRNPSQAPAAVTRLALSGVAALTVLLVLAASATSAPEDSLDQPIAVAVSGAGDVYVALRTDTDGVIRNFDGQGNVQAVWTVADTVSALAETPTGGVAALFVDGHRGPASIEFFGADGASQGGFARPFLFPGALSVGAVGRSLSPAVYVIALDPGGSSSRLVERLDVAGADIGRWSVPATSHRLAHGPFDGQAEGAVVVAHQGAFPGFANLIRYALDGSELGRAEDVLWPAALDAARTGQLWAAASTEPPGSTHVVRFETDLSTQHHCLLSGLLPIDIAVAPDGHLYVVVRQSPPGNGTYSIVKLAPDCRIVATWDQERLSGLLPTPTATASPERTAAPTATEELTPAPSVTITAETDPTGTATGMPTADWKRIFVPVAETK